MTGKKALGTLQPIEQPKVKIEAATEEISVQTVRMDRATQKALKYASIERGVTQQTIMLSAIRRDLGLE